MNAPALSDTDIAARCRAESESGLIAFLADYHGGKGCPRFAAAAQAEFARRTRRAEIPMNIAFALAAGAIAWGAGFAIALAAF